MRIKLLKDSCGFCELLKFRSLVMSFFLVIFSTTSAAETIYADGQLLADCSSSYSIINRDCSGSDGDAYVTIQDAVDAPVAGDTVKIRQGNYVHEENGTPLTFISISVSGFNSLPITIEAYENEDVLIQGFGYPEGDQGPGRTGEILLSVTGDYIHMRGLEIAYATRHGLAISGSFGLYENITVRDCWSANVMVGFNNVVVEGNILRYFESHNSRHGTGMSLTRRSNHTELLINNRIENSLSYNNGYQTDGQQVPPVTGDPAGGGNSDAFGSSKNCHDRRVAAGVINLCPNNIIINSIGFHNADDGIDVSMGDGSALVNNIVFDNGPEGRKGFKVLREVEGGLTIMGNIAMGNDDRGFEPRFNGEGYLYHNLALHHSGQGFILSGQNLTGGLVRVQNNVSAYSGSPDMALPAGILATNNWTQDSNGMPELVNITFDVNSINTTFPQGLSIAEKVEFIRAQFRTAYSPAALSSLIDAGVWVSDVHCPSADDDLSNPMPPADNNCRHWSGIAPDIGVYEYNDSPSDLVFRDEFE